MSNLICNFEVNGVPYLCSKGNPFTVDVGFILTTPDFQFDSLTDAVDQTKWEEAFAEGKMFIFKDSFGFESTDEEDVIETSSTGKKSLAREGLRSYKHTFKYSLCQHKAARLFNGNSYRVIPFNANNIPSFYSPDGAILKGFEVGYFHTGKMMKGTGEAKAQTVIEIQENTINEWDTYGVYIQGLTWLINDFNGVTGITATSGTVASNAFTLTLARVSSSKVDGTGVYDSIPITGATIDSIQLIDQAGAIVTPTTGFTLTESTTTSGEYTIDATLHGTYTGGTVQVLPQTDFLYESNLEVVS